MQQVCVDLYTPRRAVVSAKEARGIDLLGAVKRGMRGKGGKMQYLGNPSTQKGTDKVFESLELGLDDDETEIRLRIRAAGLVLDDLNLQRVGSIQQWFDL